MNKKREYEGFYFLSIILNLIAIISSSLMYLFIFLSLGLSMFALARKKELDYKKSKQ